MFDYQRVHVPGQCLSLTLDVTESGNYVISPYRKLSKPSRDRNKQLFGNQIYLHASAIVQ